MTAPTLTEAEQKFVLMSMTAGLVDYITNAFDGSSPKSHLDAYVASVLDGTNVTKSIFEWVAWMCRDHPERFGVIGPVFADVVAENPGCELLKRFYEQSRNWWSVAS